jgi:hypothetical protein
MKVFPTVVALCHLGEALGVCSVGLARCCPASLAVAHLHFSFHLKHQIVNSGHGFRAILLIAE